MKIHITEDTVRRPRTRPAQPAVSLCQEAYDKLLALSAKHNISMRKLANAIIIEACDNLVIERVGALNAGN